MSSDCLFCKIVSGQLPAKKAYEDDRTFASHDLHPGAPTHVLIVPKRHLAGLPEAAPADEALLGHLQLVAARLAGELGLEHGYRTVINVGPHAGQSVRHLHLHLLGGRAMAWPPG